MQLTGKRIIVTGGARGIGAGSVRALVSEGATVVSWSLSDAIGEVVAAEATTVGPGTATYLHCDVSSKHEVDAAFDSAIASMGGVDVLINAAGASYFAPAEEITEDDCRATFAVHVYGTMFTNQAAFRAMQTSGGSIVNFSSVAGMRGWQQMAAYAAAKAAVLGWTRSVAQEWGRCRIRVNAVVPGAVSSTPQRGLHDVGEASRHDPMPPMSDDQRAWFAQNVPYGGVPGDPERDVAPAIVFLSSDASHFITGQTIPVDGGLVMNT